MTATSAIPRSGGPTFLRRGAKSVVGGRLHLMGESDRFRHEVANRQVVTEILPIRAQSGR